MVDLLVPRKKFPCGKAAMPPEFFFPCLRSCGGGSGWYYYACRPVVIQNDFYSPIYDLPWVNVKNTIPPPPCISYKAWPWMWQELVTSQCSAIGLIIGIFTQSQAVMSQQALSHDYNSQHSMSATETNSNNPVELKKNGGKDSRWWTWCLEYKS